MSNRLKIVLAVVPWLLLWIVATFTIIDWQSVFITCGDPSPTSDFDELGFPYVTVAELGTGNIVGLPFGGYHFKDDYNDEYLLMSPAIYIEGVIDTQKSLSYRSQYPAELYPLRCERSPLYFGAWTQVEDVNTYEPANVWHSNPWSAGFACSTKFECVSWGHPSR